MAKTTFGKNATEVQRSHGVRRRFKGRMVGRDGVPRSLHIDKKRASISYECGQTEPFPTKNLPGRFKVQMPRKRTRFVAPLDVSDRGERGTT